jgi:transcriptional regulator with XRE-family HTH domain
VFILPSAHQQAFLLARGGAGGGADNRRLDEDTMAMQKNRGELDGSLGNRLRQERVRQGMSLRELARRIEVSASLISAVETGRTNPSVKTLYAIAEALGISPAAVVSTGTLEVGAARGASAEGEGAGAAHDLSPGDWSPVVRRQDRKSIDLASGVSWELLTPAQERRVEFLELVYRPQGKSGQGGQMIRHAGREYGIVTKGVLFVALEFNEYELREGDSIAFDSTIPHRLWNPSKDYSHAIWFVLDRHSDQNVADNVSYLHSHMM